MYCLKFNNSELVMLDYHTLSQSGGRYSSEVLTVATVIIMGLSSQEKLIAPMFEGGNFPWHMLRVSLKL